MPGDIWREDALRTSARGITHLRKTFFHFLVEILNDQCSLLQSHRTNGNGHLAVLVNERLHI